MSRRSRGAPGSHSKRQPSGAVPVTTGQRELRTRAAMNHIVGPIPKGQPHAVCPVCGLEVGVRKDSTLGNHRVGTDRQNSWPCAGSGQATLNLEGE